MALRSMHPTCTLPPEAVMRTTLLAALVSIVLGSAALAQEKPAGEQPKVTYDDHVRPILREHCLTCHNANDAKGGLVLDTYAKTMAGGSGGEVVLPGDPENSRLYALVAHLEEPIMPPKQDKIAEAKLSILKKWIESGALENSGSKAIIKKKKTFEFSGGGAGKPEVVAMPEGLWRQPVVYTPRAGSVTALASSPWAPIVAVAGQRQIVLYNSDSAECVGVLPFPEGIPYVLRFSPNGSVLLAGGGRGGHSGFVALYDVKTGKRIAKIGDELDAVLAADINASHSLVALGGPQRLVRIYSTEGELLHEIKKHTDWVYSIEFSPDGVLLATSDRSGGVFVWEAETAREYLNLRGHSGGVTDVSWRGDSNVLATAGDDGTVKLWEMNDGNQIKTWNAHPGGVTSVSYSHEGNLISTGNDKLAKTWDGNGVAVKSLPAFGELVLRGAFTHDGKRVVAGDWLGEIRLFDAAAASEVAKLASNPPTLAMLIEAQTAAIAPLEAAATSQATELAAMTKSMQEKASAVTAASNALAAASEAAQKTEAERAAAEKQVVEATAKHKSLNDALPTLTQSHKAASDAKAAADKLAAEKAAGLKTANDKLVAAQSAHDSAIAAKSAAEKALAEATAAKQAAESAADAEAIAKAEEARAAAEKGLAEKAAAVTATSAALDTAKAEAASAAKQHDEAVSALKTKTEAVLAAEAKLAEAQKAEQQSTKEKTLAAEQLVAKTSAKKSADEQLAAAKSAADKQAAEKAELDKQLAAKQAAANSAAKQLADAKAKLERTVAEKAAFEQAEAKLAQAAEQAAQQLAAAQQVMTKAEAVHSEKAAAAKAVAEKAAAIKAELDKLVAEQQKLEALAAEQQKALAAAQEAAATAQAAADKAAAEKQLFTDAYPKK